MAVCITSSTAPPKTRLPMGAFLILALIAGLLAPLLAEAKKPAITLPTIRVDPAIANKHPESPTVRRCTDNNQPFMIYKAKEGDSWYILCQIKEAGEWTSKWSLRIIAKDAEGWFEKSAYVPKDGTWTRVVTRYLETFATRWKSPLP